MLWYVHCSAGLPMNTFPDNVDCAALCPLANVCSIPLTYILNGDSLVSTRVEKLIDVMPFEKTGVHQSDEDEPCNTYPLYIGLPLMIDILERVIDNGMLGLPVCM